MWWIVAEMNNGLGLVNAGDAVYTVLGGSAVALGGGEGLVANGLGQRVCAGPDNVPVLVIAAPDATIQEITAVAEVRRGCCLSVQVQACDNS